MRQQPRDSAALSRNAHYLRVSTATPWPRCSVALALVTETEAAGRVVGERQVRLVSWQAVAWQGVDGEGKPPILGAGLSVDSWWRYLLTVQSRFTTTWVWQLGAAHGLTLLGFWQQLEAGEWVIPGLQPASPDPPKTTGRLGGGGICVISDPPTVILSRRAHLGGSVRWVDLRNLGVDCWQDLGAARPDAAAMSCWLREWYDLVRALNLGGLRATAAGQAWHGWRHGHLSAPLLVHNDSESIRRERSALHPGRCECARIAVRYGGVYQIDASAHYPACAADNVMPGVIRKGTVSGTSAACSAAERGYCVIAECQIRTDIPVAPLRREDSTIWPVGRFATTLCWPEVELALRSGAHVEVGRAALYEPSTPFGAFFAILWSERAKATANGNAARVSCVKRMMNALIGRLAAWDWVWEPAPGRAPEYAYGTWIDYAPWVTPERMRELADRLAAGEPSEIVAPYICKYRSVGWHSQWERCGGESDDSMPAITAWICSLARVRLWEWVQTAGPENVLYYDTDSLWTTERGYRCLEEAGHFSSIGMGALRLVKRHEWALFRGQKYYETPDCIVCAGVGMNRQLNVCGYHYHWIPERLRDAISHRRAPESVELRYRCPVGRVYRHGNVGPDGTVTPLRLP